MAHSDQSIPGPISEQPFYHINEGVDLFREGLLLISRKSLLEGVSLIFQGGLTVLAGILLNAGLLFARYYTYFFYLIIKIFDAGFGFITWATRRGRNYPTNVPTTPTRSALRKGRKKKKRKRT